MCSFRKVAKLKLISQVTPPLAKTVKFISSKLYINLNRSQNNIFFFLDEGSYQQSECPPEFSDTDTDSEAASDSGSDTEEDAQTSSKVHLLRRFKGKHVKMYCINNSLLNKKGKYLPQNILKLKLKKNTYICN